MVAQATQLPQLKKTKKQQLLLALPESVAQKLPGHGVPARNPLIEKRPVWGFGSGTKSSRMLPE
jgi:hypothetical protein